MAKQATSTVTDVRKNCQIIGDKLYENFSDTGDLKAAQASVQAYSAALKAATSHLIYKKLTGKPGKIKFFEAGD